MSARLTLNPNQRPVTLDKAVETIAVHVGRVLVNSVELLATGDTYQAGGKAGLRVNSPDGASILITYSEDVPS